MCFRIIEYYCQDFSFYVIKILMHTIRCRCCYKLLAKIGHFDSLEIKCSRCKSINILSTESALPERLEHQKQVRIMNIQYNPKGHSFSGWVGGKSQLARTIVELMPEHKTYVEVFGGAGWVLLKVPFFC